MTSRGPFQACVAATLACPRDAGTRVLLGRPACWFLQKCKCLLNLTTCGPSLQGACSPFPSVAGRVCVGRE